MWNKLRVIWHGMSGHFQGYHPVESRYWLFVIGSVVSLVILWVNSSVSFNFYRFNVLTKAVGLSGSAAFTGAVVLTFILAFAAWVLLAFLAYLASAKLNQRHSALVGISTSDVFFSLLGVVFLAGLDIYANLHGVEEIVLQSTVEHMADPTLRIDTTFEDDRGAVIARFEARRGEVQTEIDRINRWTGKAHSCTRTGCPTRKQGQGTIGAHWKGTLTSFGSQVLNDLKAKLEALESEESDELDRIDQRRESVQTSLMGAYTQDVRRYQTELNEKNRTLKGFVLIAYPFSFIIEFLLAGVTFIGLEYLYRTSRLQRPNVTVYANGEFDSSLKVKNGARTMPTESVRGSKQGYEITCQQCGTVAVKHHPRAKFCSDRCRAEWHKREQSYVSGSNGHVG